MRKAGQKPGHFVGAKQMNDKQTLKTSTEMSEGSISFESGDFQILGKDQFHPVQVNTMPIVHFVDGVPRPLGSCFAISNDGLAITARHVIDEAFAEHFVTDDPNVDIPPHHQLHAIYASNTLDPETGHFVGGPLPIVRIWFSSATDIAVLQLNVPTNSQTGKKLYLPAAQLSPGLPKVGDNIFGLGYHSMKWTSTGEGFQADQRFSASRGHVQDIHFPQRDRIFMSFPCFQTSARFDGGMSGGPIISQSGQVCGVICSSMKTDVSDGTFTSYGSLIAPALALVLFGKDPSGNERKIFLHDFVIGGAVGVDETCKNIHITNTGNELLVDLGGGRAFRNLIHPSL
jgi:S1-C subfamily serine protease